VGYILPSVELDPAALCRAQFNAYVWNL